MTPHIRFKYESEINSLMISKAKDKVEKLLSHNNFSTLGLNMSFAKDIIICERERERENH